MMPPSDADNCLSMYKLLVLASYLMAYPLFDLLFVNIMPAVFLSLASILIKLLLLSLCKWSICCGASIPTPILLPMVNAIFDPV